MCLTQNSYWAVHFALLFSGGGGGGGRKLVRARAEMGVIIGWGAGEIEGNYGTVLKRRAEDPLTPFPLPPFTFPAFPLPPFPFLPFPLSPFPLSPFSLPPFPLPPHNIYHYVHGGCFN